MRPGPGRSAVRRLQSLLPGAHEAGKLGVLEARAITGRMPGRNQGKGTTMGKGDNRKSNKETKKPKKEKLKASTTAGMGAAKAEPKKGK